MFTVDLNHSASPFVQSTQEQVVMLSFSIRHTQQVNSDRIHQVLQSS